MLSRNHLHFLCNFLVIFGWKLSWNMHEHFFCFLRSLWWNLWQPYRDLRSSDMLWLVRGCSRCLLVPYWLLACTGRLIFRIFRLGNKPDQYDNKCLARKRGKDFSRVLASKYQHTFYTTSLQRGTGPSYINSAGCLAVALWHLPCPKWLIRKYLFLIFSVDHSSIENDACKIQHLSVLIRWLARTFRELCSIVLGRGSTIQDRPEFRDCVLAHHYNHLWSIPFLYLLIIWNLRWLHRIASKHIDFVPYDSNPQRIVHQFK